MSELQTAPLAEGDVVIQMETTHGTILIKLFPEQTPKTCANFIGLTKKGYYDGIVFHRVIRDFMIQGGDPTGTGRGGESIYGRPFEDEFHPELKNIHGALSMANSGRNSNGSQFFIVHAKSTPWLDRHHTVFGQVVNGMEIVDTIANEPVDRNDRPLAEAKMIKVEVKVWKDGKMEEYTAE